jgi:hypothetical protein
MKFPMKPDRQLRKIIDGLRNLEQKCFASRSRFAFYDYLAAVFELYVQLRLRLRNQAKPLARRIATAGLVLSRRVAKIAKPTGSKLVKAPAESEKFVRWKSMKK